MGAIRNVCVAGVFAISASGFVGSAAQALTVTPGDSSIDLFAFSEIVTGGINATDSDFVSQSGTLNDLSASVSATALDGLSSLTTQANMSASFGDAGSGQVVVTDAGMSSNDVFDGNSQLFNGVGFSYEFTIDTEGLFSITVDNATDPNTTFAFGLNGINLEDLGNGVSGNAFTNVFNPADGSGSLTRTLAAGTYSMILKIGVDVQGGLGDRLAQFDSTIDWSVTDSLAPVPVPPAFALMGAAIFGLGALRLRRKLTQA